MVYVREDLCELFHLLMHEGEEVYISQDGLIMHRILGDSKYCITATQDGDYTHVISIVKVYTVDLIEDFIDDNYATVYERYCEIHPEGIHSDWYLEDAPDIEDFILTYMNSEYEEYYKKKGV